MGIGGARCGRAPMAAAAAALALLAVSAPASATSGSLERSLRAAAAPGAQLRATDSVTLPGGVVIRRFQQRIGGVEVLGAQAVVSDGPGAPPRLVADSTRRVAAAPVPPRIARSRAVAIASRELEVRGLRGEIEARLGIDPGGGGTLAWRVLIPAQRPLGDFEVLVDARSGAVIARHDLLRFQTGKAKLFDPNPVVQHGGARGLKKDDGDRDTRLLRKLRRPVSLTRIDEGQSCLRGRWAHVLRGPNGKETCERDLRWGKVTRSNNRFEALMVYFHVTRSQRYIQSLGFSDSNAAPNGIADRVQLAVADATMPPSLGQDNSFFLPSTGEIMYGRGGVDDAEDADVIVHEYAHAMQASESPAFGNSNTADVVAIAEGSSDYWAAVMSSLAPGTRNEDQVCVFDWDATSYGKFFTKRGSSRSGRRCGRRADRGRSLDRAKKKCPRVWTGGRPVPDPHCVGEVWSSALWDMRKALVARMGAAGGTRMDRVYLASQFMYTAKERFKGAAKALLCANEDLYPSGAPGDCRGADHAVISREVRARGFL